MPSAVFEFFELVCEELEAVPSRVITDLSAYPSLDMELQNETKTTRSADAIKESAKILAAHFSAREVQVPFDFDPTTSRFSAVDSDYLEFVREMAKLRSDGKQSRDFECGIADRLLKRVTGAVHRVGHPRDRKKTKAQFNRHLKKLGFQKSTIYGQEKDGGLDILWMLPLGCLPHRPLVALQCKNGKIDWDAAHASVGTCTVSMGKHCGLLSQVHVPCVVFNDYMSKDEIGVKAMTFVPLGLSDLATPTNLTTIEKI